MIWRDLLIHCCLGDARILTNAMVYQCRGSCVRSI